MAGDRKWRHAGLRRSGWQLAALGLGWLAGLGLQLQQPSLWPLVAGQGITAAGVLGWLLAMRWPPARRLWLLALAAAAVAFGSTAWRADVRLADRLDASLEGQDLLVTGVVTSLPQTGPAGSRFGFDVEAATWRGAPVRLPARLALGWYAGFHDEAWLDDPRADLQAGQRWRLPLRLKRPHGSLNPDGYDVELQWFEQGMGATGYVRVVHGEGGRQAAVLLAEGVGHPVDRLRQHIRDALLRTVTDARAAGVLAALTVGDQAAIEREDWELFRTTGIAHLVSISGVHVTMFAWLAGLLVAGVWRRSPALMLRLPAPVAGRWLGLLAATGYALLAGWGVPAQRTVLMLAVTVLLRSAGWRWPWALVLLAAAVGVTVADPWSLLQPGFWLSFSAVALLTASEPAAGRDRPVPGWRGLLAGHLRAQLVATLGLAPLSLVFFQQFSGVGFLANLVAIPLVTLLITPLALLGMLAPPLWLLAAGLVQAMVVGLGWLAQVPLATWTVPAAPAWLVATGVLGALLAVLPAPIAWRWLALPLVLPLLWPAVPRPAPGHFSALVADVGQGTAVLLRTREHLLVYDAGPQYSRESDAGQRVLLPLLRARGERRIDLLMLSHRDTDHVGGAARLLDALPVRGLSTSLADAHPLRQLGIPHQACRAGQRWTWDGVRFAVLHPGDDDVAFAARPNAVSCVLRVEDAAGHSLLLAGDIEAAQEAALLQRDAAALASSVLLVPHHGSRTSSTAGFLDAVRPQVAVVQAGYRNRFGHPAAEVLVRHTERGITVVRTDGCGAWLWHDGVTSCTRDVRGRYWHAGGSQAGLGQAPAGGAVFANPVGSGVPSP
jgi:competence protein ComEC